VSPLSPVLAKVINTSAPFVKLVTPDKYAMGNVLFVPLSDIVPVIENMAKVLALDFKEILKCPLILEVVAFIDVIKLEMSVPTSSNSCKKRLLAEDKVVLLNLAPPFPIPVLFVVVEYV
jgi:hypothetical protein